MMNNNVRQRNSDNGPKPGKNKNNRRRGKKAPKATNSPPIPHIFALPPEVLSHIFEIGTILPDLNGRDGDDDPSPFPHFAVLCSHVCRHFRQIALSTPQLWTYIDFREGFPYQTAHTFLLRSKDAPLTLDIDLTNGSDTQGDRYIIEDIKSESDKIYSMISHHVHRWKDFELKADYFEVIRYWLLKLSEHDSAPRLENIGVFCHEDWDGVEEFQPKEFGNALSIFTGGTPRVKSVELWGVHFDWNNITFLRGLRTLRLAWHARDVGLTTIQFMEILKQCPDLYELSLQHSGPVKGAWPVDCVALEHLEVLELAYLDLETAINILKHVQFPVLKDLSLDLEQDSVTPFISPFVAHPQRFNNVQSLKLRSFQCSNAEASAFLAALPGLTSINLNFNYLANGFLTVLRSRLCPKLHTLKLSGLPFHMVKKILQSRPSRSITTLYLDKTDPWEKHQIRWLEKAVETIRFYTCSDDEEATSSDGPEEEYEGGYASGTALDYDPHYQIYGDNGHMYDD